MPVAACSPNSAPDVYNAFIRGDQSVAIELQKKVSLIPMMGGFGPNAAVVKFGLNKLGVCGPTVAAPFALAAGQDAKFLPG